MKDWTPYKDLSNVKDEYKYCDLGGSQYLVEIKYSHYDIYELTRNSMGVYYMLVGQINKRSLESIREIHNRLLDEQEKMNGPYYVNI